MSFENFLQFWSVHNRQIIEFVFVSTFVLILFVIYRQFFAKSESTAGAGGHANPVSIDTSEIEEKLRKILENQSTYKTVPTEAATAATAVAPAAAVDTQELEKLRNEIKEKEKSIEELKKTAAAAPVAPSGGGGSKEDVKKFEDKIKELEGRLQEYEIISEDIADLSFYKEENARLQKELGAKGSAPVAAEPVAEPPVTEVVEAEPAPVASTPAPAEIPVAAEPVSTPEPVAAQVAPGAIDSVIDDDILKEFAAAVEGQKQAEKPSKVASTPPPSEDPGASPSVAEPAQAVDPQKLTESKELMGEFENFIKKG